MNFPASGAAVPVRLEVFESPRGTVWARNFDGRRVRTVQRVVDGMMVECRAPGRLFFQVSVVEGAVVYESVRFSVFGLVVPSWLAPRATGRVTATENGWQAEISVVAPVVGLLTGYTARLR